MSAPIEVLYLSDSLASEVVRDADRRYPAEACGFVIGRRQGPSYRARRVVAAANRARRPDRFLIAAADVFVAMRAARDDDCEVIGVYHSHPYGHATPSAVDRREAWHEWLHLIVACAPGSRGRAERPKRARRPRSGTPPGPEAARERVLGRQMRCWRWDGADFVPVHIRSEGT